MVAAHDPDQRCRSTSETTGAWLDGFPLSKWVRLRLSFSAWLYSPSSGFPFGQNYDGLGAPGLTPSFTRSRRIASLAGFFDLSHVFDSPLPIRRIRSLRHDPFQPHLADVLEDRRAAAGQVFVEADGARLLSASHTTSFFLVCGFVELARRVISLC